MGRPSSAMKTTLPDYYALLGLPASSSPGDVARAYRQQCFLWHPDRHPDAHKRAHQRFLAIAEAYAVLGEPSARTRYDRTWKRFYGGDEAEVREDRSGNLEGFDAVVQAATRSREQASIPSGRAYEREVRRIMEQLAAQDEGHIAVTRGDLFLRAGAVLLTIAASQGLVLMLSATGDQPDLVLRLVALLPPLVACLPLLWVCYRGMRQKVRARRFREPAERIVERRATI